MKILKIALILLIAAAIWSFVTGGKSFHIARVLPFCHGGPITWGYELAGLVMLGLFLWGLHRLNRGRRDRKEE